MLGIPEVTPEIIEQRKQIKIGDKVRSYDFHPKMIEGREMYVEGVVTGFPHRGIIEINVTKDTVHKPDGRTVVSFPIETMLFDFPERVQVIG